MTTPSSSSFSPRPSQDEIAQRAREIWVARGQPHGQDLDIWFEAERQLQLPSTTPSKGATDQTAIEPGATGQLRPGAMDRKTLSEKVEENLNPGGYGQGGTQRIGPSV